MHYSLLYALAIALFSFAAMNSAYAESSSLTPEGAGGRQVYIQHCASCHGLDGKGSGPAANALRMAPSDLTQIAKQNEGSFPSEKIMQQIDGREIVGAHGSREMPVWGRQFRGPLNGELGEELVRGKLKVLVEYLKSIQK